MKDNQLIDSAVQSAIKELGLACKKTLTSDQSAQVQTLAIQVIAKTYMTAKESLIEYAIQVYMAGDVTGSWTKWVHSTLGGILSESFLSLIAQGTPILVDLRQHPVTKRGIKIDDKALIRRQSSFADMLHTLLVLDRETKEGNARFEKLVIMATTQPRAKLRTFLKKEEDRDQLGDAEPMNRYVSQKTSWTDPTNGKVLADVYVITVVCSSNDEVNIVNEKLANVTREIKL